ncbi:plasmid stabilization protein [Candidatus Microgenomates bacterium]|nr:plasmid stabilization protein [Candidatus Microgenomates bacterium]
MINIKKTSRYERERNKFIRNNPIRGKSLIKTLKTFTNNPNHPSLNLEKLSGTKIWTIRIDKSSRIFFYWINDETALFIDIGKHDKYRKY